MVDPSWIRPQGFLKGRRRGHVRRPIDTKSNASDVLVLTWTNP